jgi:CHAT domain
MSDGRGVLRLLSIAIGIRCLVLLGLVSALSACTAGQPSSADGTAVAARHADPAQKTECSADVAVVGELLRQHTINEADLLLARMLPPALQPHQDVTGLLYRIQGWLTNQGGSDAVLFFTRDDSHHCAFIINESGVAAVGRSDASTADLSGMNSQWRAAVGAVSGREGAREATKVGERSTPMSRPSPQNAGSALLEQLASALFPGEVRAGLLEYRRLYIVPYGDLGAIPYWALPSGVDVGQALVDSVSISVVQSTDVLLGEDVLRETRSQVSRSCRMGSSALVVSVPEAADYGGYSFRPLKGAEREAANIAALLGSTARLEVNASTTTFMEQASTARYVHVASHGMANEVDPMEGFLALADGGLTAQVIQDSCIPAQLVVLSACQTGLGQPHAGGIIGLARAFLLAGSDEAIMSLWNVDDEATELLMSLFWERMARRREGETASDLLRAAMLQLREEYPRVLYWAPFAVFGVPSPDTGASGSVSPLH